MADEQMQILDELWGKEHASFAGQLYSFDDVAFYPKPIQQPRIPIWVGGEGAAAQKRAGRYGDAWFPYFVEITPPICARARQRPRDGRGGRDADVVHLAVCRPIEVTPRAGDAGREPPARVAGATRRGAGCVSRDRRGASGAAIHGPRWPERMEQIARFAAEVMPHVR